MSKLTKKQEAFIDEYLIDLNATQAAIRAGYSQKTAGKIGTENLQKPVIQNCLKERMQQKESERIASADEVLQRLTEIARGQAEEEIIGFWDGEPVRVKKEPYIKDRIKALELLGKRHMLFTDKIEHSDLFPKM